MELAASVAAVGSATSDGDVGAPAACSSRVSRRSNNTNNQSRYFLGSMGRSYNAGFSGRQGVGVPGLLLWSCLVALGLGLGQADDAPALRILTPLYARPSSELVFWILSEQRLCGR